MVYWCYCCTLEQKYNIFVCFPNKICKLIILYVGATVIEFSSHKTNNMIYRAICGKSVLRDMQCLENNQSQDCMPSQMSVLKAFGLNGFLTLFYQKYWRITINVVRICSHKSQCNAGFSIKKDPKLASVVEAKSF